MTSMAICPAVGRIGAAYFDQEYGHVYIFEDVVESYASCDILRQLIAHVKPDNVIAAAKQDDKVMYHLKNLCVSAAAVTAASDPDDDLFDDNLTKPRLTLLRSWDFGFTSCKQRICTVIGNSFGKHDNSDDDIGVWNATAGQPKGISDEETRLRAAYAINFDATCSVRALGALLKYLNLKKLGKADEIENAANSLASSDAWLRFQNDEAEANKKMDGVYSIKKFTLEKTLKIDVGSFEALQVFQQQYHPSVYKAGKSGMREGLSLFNICNFCRSGPGTAELRRWFLRPLSDIVALQRRLDSIEYLVDDNNVEIVDAMSKTLQQVRNLTTILNRMQVSRARVNDWISLHKTLTSCSRLGDLIRIREFKPALVAELAEKFGESLHEVCTLLTEVIDLDACRKENRFIVKPNVDEELDARKAFFRRLPEFMAAVAEEQMATLDLGVNECTIIYMPLLGYLLAMPQLNDCSSETGTWLEQEGLELVFVVNGLAHYKNEATRRMDMEFGDVKFKIVDRETSIMLNLQTVVLEKAGDLLDAVQNAAQLDCLISLAAAAKAFKWTKPRLLEDNMIRIYHGRHPLQELVCSNNQFVTNPTISGGLGEPRQQQVQEESSSAGQSSPLTSIREVPAGGLAAQPKVHMLTGPNASGKSVYLKQVGLIVYMAHVGSFVPAAKAEIGIMDGIFTRIRTMDSISSEFSSFGIDVRQMAEPVKHATAQSLVLIDEFGKGTSTEVGAGLLTSCLEYWLRRGIDHCPHIFVCSHLYCVLGLLPQSHMLEYQTMSIMKDGDELVFLYKLINGTTNSSLATNIAQAAGLPISVIERAAEVLNNIQLGLPIRRYDMNEEEYQDVLRRMTNLIDRFMGMNLNNRPFLRMILEQHVETATLSSPGSEAGISSYSSS